MDGPDHLDNIVGPGPGCLRHFVSRGWEEAAPCASKLRKARWRHSLIVRHTSLWMDGPDHLDNIVGPGPRRLRHFASRGWEEAGPRSSKSRRARRRWSPIVRHVLLRDGWIRSFGDI